MHLLLFLKSQLLLEETLEHVYAMDCYESASFRYKEERGILRRLWFSPLFSDLPTKKKKKKRDWGWRIRAEEVTGSQRLKSSSIPFSLEWELYMRRTLASSLSLSLSESKKDGSFGVFGEEIGWGSQRDISEFLWHFALRQRWASAII